MDDAPLFPLATFDVVPLQLTLAALLATQPTLFTFRIFASR